MNGITTGMYSGDMDMNDGSPIRASGSPYWATTDGGTPIPQECYYNTGGNDPAKPEVYNLKYPDNLNCTLAFQFQ